MPWGVDIIESDNTAELENESTDLLESLCCFVADGTCDDAGDGGLISREMYKTRITTKTPAHLALNLYAPQV